MNIYDYDVNNVIPEIVVKSIGNLTIKHLFFSCFYSGLLPFSEFKEKKKKKERNKRKEIYPTASLINIKVSQRLQMSVSIILICLWLIQNTILQNGIYKNKIYII